MSTAAVVPLGVQGSELVLEGITGGAFGSRYQIAAGTTATVGRGDKAKIMIVRDGKLSGIHFEVGWANGQWTLKDLESTNGTHLNARRVVQAQLRNGDVITAGESGFRVRLTEMEKWDDMTPAEAALLTLLYGAGERVFALLDAARDDRIPAVLQACDAEHASLYDGERAYHLRSVAPYIAVVPRQSKLNKLLFREGWGKSWGVYLTAMSGLQDLRQHLQRFLTFPNASGQRYYYRFYDPRVLRHALQTPDKAARARFFGPVMRYIAEDDAPNVALDFWNTSAEPSSRKVVLGA